MEDIDGYLVDLLGSSKEYEAAILSVLRKYTPTRETTKWHIPPTQGNYHGLEDKDISDIKREYRRDRPSRSGVSPRWANYRRKYGNRQPGTLANSWEMRIEGRSIKFVNTAEYEGKPWAKFAFGGHKIKAGFKAAIRRQVKKDIRVKALSALDDSGENRLSGQTARTSLKNRVARYTKEIIKANKSVIAEFVSKKELKKLEEIFDKKISGSSGDFINVFHRSSKKTRETEQVRQKLIIPRYEPKWRK